MDQEPLLWQLEANIDDAEPRVVAHAVSKAMGSGAVDAWMEPTYGKKGRLGVKICAIVRQKALESVSRVVLEETTTLGLRAWPIQRRELQRRSINLQTPMGEVSVKVGHDGSRIVNVQTEHDSATELAASSGLPLKAILQATIAAATEAGIMVGAPADIIETVDSVRLADALEAACAAAGRVMPVLVEVNSGRETSKSGVFPEDLEKLVRGLQAYEHIRVEGLMTMGPRFGDPELARPFFRATREAFEHLSRLDLPNVSMQTLSMGMSNSYQIAIEEGANLVRIGTLLFGERPV